MTVRLDGMPSVRTLRLERPDAVPTRTPVHESAPGGPESPFGVGQPDAHRRRVPNTNDFNRLGDLNRARAHASFDSVHGTGAQQVALGLMGWGVVEGGGALLGIVTESSESELEGFCPGGRCYGAGPFSFELKRDELRRVREAAASFLSKEGAPNLPLGRQPGWSGFSEILPGGADGTRELTSSDAQTAAKAVQALEAGLQSEGLDEDLAKKGAFALVTAIRNAGYTGDSASRPGHPGIAAFGGVADDFMDWANARFGVTSENLESEGRISQDELSLMQHYMYGSTLGVPRDAAHLYYSNATRKERDSSDEAIDLQWQSYLRGRLAQTDEAAAVAEHGPYDSPFGDDQGTDSFDPWWGREFPQHRP